MRELLITLQLIPPSFSPMENLLLLTLIVSSTNLWMHDGSGVKRVTFGNGIYGTLAWFLGRFDCIYKNAKRKIYIGVMRTDGTGERLLTENYTRRHLHGRQMEEYWFFIERQSRSKGEGFSAKLWSIDITGYNERRLKLKQMPDHLVLSLSKKRDIYEIH